MSNRGRGVRHGAVNIKVERIIHNQEHQERGGVYEDEVVYVTERPPRKRGRPRRTGSIVTSVTSRRPPQPLAQQSLRSVISNDVIYVTSGRARPQYMIPSRGQAQHSIVHHPSRRPGALISQGSRQLALCAALCPSPVRCVLTGVTSAGQKVLNVTKPLRPLEAQRICAENPKIDWPTDVQELVNNWDNLPERWTRDVVKWFQTVNSNSQMPKIVREIQDMWSNMSETWEEKMDLILECLQDDESVKRSAPPSSNTPVTVKNAASLLNCGALQSKTVTLPSHGVASATRSVVSPLRSVALLTVSRAKVLVEAQPTPIQDCSQWSSMAENSKH